MAWQPTTAGECDNCGYECSLTTSANGLFSLCEVCSCTHLSHPILFQPQYAEDRMLFKSLAWVANRILDEIRKEQKKQD